MCPGNTVPTSAAKRDAWWLLWRDTAIAKTADMIGRRENVAMGTIDQCSTSGAPPYQTRCSDPDSQHGPLAQTLLLVATPRLDLLF